MTPQVNPVEFEDRANVSGYPVFGSTVCFIFTMAQLNKILKLGIGKLDGTLVVSFRVNLSVILENNGIKFINAWDLLAPDDLEDATRQGNIITESWSERFETDLIYKSHCIPELDRSCLRFLFQDSVYLKVVFERLTGAMVVRRCVLISSFDQPFEFHPQNTEIHACLIAEFCKQKGIPLVAIPLIAPESFHFGNRIPKIARNCGDFPVPNEFSGQEENSVIGAEPCRVGILMDVINDHEYYIRMLMSAGFSVTVFSLWNDEARIRKLESIGCRIVPLGIPSDNSEGEPYEELFGPAHKRFEDCEDDLFREYSYIFRNRWLKFQFNHVFFRRWPQLCRFIDHAGQICSEVKIDALITAAYDVPESVILANEARKHGIPVIAVPHSSNLELRQPWTDVERTCFLMDHHIPVDRPRQSNFRVIGSPRRRLKQTNGNRSYAAQDLRKEMGLPAEKKLVFAVTNSFYEGLIPFSDPSETIAWMRAIANIPIELSGRVAVVWKSKSHADDSSIHNKLISESGKDGENIVVPATTEFEKVASVCDLAVGLNCWTTGFIDIILNGKPLLLTGVSTSLGAESFYGRFVVPDSSIPQVRMTDELWPLVESVLFDQTGREKLISRQKGDLLKSMPLENTPALMNDLITEVISENKRFNN